MKKITVWLFSSVIMLGFFFGNCNKSDDPPAPTKTELMTRSSWKFKSATAAGIGDVSGNIPACYKDNLFLFASNNTGSVDESANICSPSSAGPFTWALQSGDTQLFISTVLFPGGAQTFNFISVSETDLVVSQTLNPPLSQPLLITFTFIH